MVFGGGILGGAHKIWGNPYLNSTTVLFDNWGGPQFSEASFINVDTSLMYV